MGILPSIRFCCPGGLGSRERETDDNRRDRWISPQTTPILREEANGVTPRTDHTSRTNTTATRRRGGTRGGREATATKKKAGQMHKGKLHQNKTLKKINPPQFFHSLVNFFFLSSFSALFTKNTNSLPPLEKIFISSYSYTIQTETENKNSFSKDETQQELCFREGKTLRAESCVSNAPSLLKT